MDTTQDRTSAAPQTAAERRAFLAYKTIELARLVTKEGISGTGFATVGGMLDGWSEFIHANLEADPWPTTVRGLVELGIAFGNNAEILSKVTTAPARHCATALLDQLREENGVEYDRLGGATLRNEFAD